MNKAEFEKFVLDEVKKYLPQKNIITEEAEQIGEEITADQIKQLVSEMKKINKKIDLRNPFIDPEGKLLENIIPSQKVENKEMLNETQKNRWNRLLNYNIPNDENR